MRSRRASALGVAKDRIAQCGPINRAVPDRARKCRLDGANRPPAARLQPMHRGIRIEHRYARAAESGCCCRLAHADAAGQSEDLHRIGKSTATNWRSSSSTCGSTPNQA